MEPALRRRLTIAASFFTIWIVWGSTYLVIRHAIETIPPMSMAGSRFLIAGVLMLAFARLRGNAWPAPRQWASAAVVGVLMLSGGNGLVTWAEQTVPSSIAALLITTVPLWMILLDAWVYRGLQPQRRHGLGLLIGFLGVGVLVRPTGDELGALPWLGCLALVVASFSWANGSLLSRRLALPTSAAMALGAEMLAGGTLLFAIGVARGEPSGFAWSQVSALSAFSVAYLVVFGSIASLSAYLYLLRTVSSTAVSTYAFVNPIVAVFLGWWIADEPITTRVLVAAGLIVGAVVVILVPARSVARAWRRRRSSPVAPTASSGSGAPVLPDGSERQAHAEA